MDRARIVVGIDGSEGSLSALHLAAGEARLRDGHLEVIHIYQPPALGTLPAFGVAAPVGDSLEELRAALEATLADEGIGTDGDSIAVTARVVAGHPAEALLDAAEGAELVVVGSRGRGGFAGLVLGSVSQQVASHAPCPVMVVPPPRQ